MAKLPGRNVEDLSLPKGGVVQPGAPQDGMSPAQYAATRAPEPPKKRGTLPSGGGGDRLAQAIGQAGTPQELLPPELPVPEAPKLPHDQLPEGARRRMAAGAPMTLSDLGAAERAGVGDQVNHSQAAAAGIARRQEAAAAAKQLEDPTGGDEKEKAEAERLAEAEASMIEEEKAARFLLKPDANQPASLHARLASEERRKAIESKLAPLDIGELITTNTIRQVVPVAGSYQVEFRSPRQHELLYCMSYVQDKEGSDQYIATLYDTCLAACALVRVGPKVLPSHISGDGSAEEMVDPKLFEAKLGAVLGMASAIVADVMIQYQWFVERVADLYGLERVKNG